METGLAVQIVVVAALLVVLWLLPGWPLRRRRLARLGRRLRILPPEPPVPHEPAIERIAADAARLRSAIHRPPAGVPVARMRGWLAAYDEVLVAACRALDLDQRLTSLPPGTERELERERVERALVRAGLLRGPAG